MNRPTTIIPIASGKGGVGKSVLTANLAIALAKLNQPTIAVDLDLGGSNLHTMLGLANNNPGIGDYLKGGRPSLQQLLVPTAFPNLRFLPGDGRTPFMANIPFRQRLSLMQELYRLPASFMLLDLGAGSTFNTLNFFGLSKRAAVVTTFDTPAIMNMLMFLRNFMFRLITSQVKPRNPEIFSRLLTDFRQPIQSAPLTVEAIFRTIAAADPALATQVQKTCKTYRPRLLFNMGDRREDLQLWKKVQTIITESLSLDAVCFGLVLHDDQVRRAIRQKKILLADYPQSRAAVAINEIAGRMARDWETDQSVVS